MGLGTKLNIAFLTVILVMVLGHAGYTLVIEYLSGQKQSNSKIDETISSLRKNFDFIVRSNQEGATVLAQDSAFSSAFQGKDREAVASAIKNFMSKSGFSGFVSIIDEKGKVFYSSETPAKFGYSVRDESAGVENVLLRGTNWNGIAGISAADTISISAMVPTRGGVAGVVSLNQPIDQELLSGLATKFAFEAQHITGIDMALFSGKENKITAATSDLPGKDGGVLSRINQEGAKALPNGELGGRLWRQLPLDQAPGKAIGVILISTIVPNIWPKVINVLGQAAAAGGIAVILAFVFAAGISGHINSSMRFLIQRARDLAAQKPALAPLEGLSDDFLELGELMDTSVSSMRSTVSSLRQQLGKFNFDVDEKVKEAETSQSQLEAVNRQLSVQTKQLAEVSKQVNFANQQTVLLQQKLDAVLQISTEGYLILDQFGNVISANPVFLHWMGVSEGEIAGRHCFDLVRKPGEPPANDDASQVFVKHGSNPADLINHFYPEGVIYHRYQNQAVDVLSHLQPVVSEDTKIQGWIMVLRDKSLHSEIALLRADIVTMLNDSIRTPLLTAEGLWIPLLNNAAQSMSPSAGQSLAELHATYEQLIAMVDSLLMVYGGFVPPPPIPREQIVVSRLVADCLEEMSTLAREYQLMLDYKTATGLPSLNADRETIKSILLQLLEKMISITAPGGRVRVESQVKGSEMRIGVSSSGPAISQDDIIDMFEGFIQGKHSEDTYGTRLSLYLARNNVERLGGKIWAESEEGRGTAIYFILPVG